MIEWGASGWAAATGVQEEVFSVQTVPSPAKATRRNHCAKEKIAEVETDFLKCR